MFKAPTLDNIKNKVFGFNDKCYKFDETNVSCSTLPNKDNSNNNEININGGTTIIDIEWIYYSFA